MWSALTRPFGAGFQLAGAGWWLTEFAQSIEARIRSTLMATPPPPRQRGARTGTGRQARAAACVRLCTSRRLVTDLPSIAPDRSACRRWRR